MQKYCKDQAKMTRDLLAQQRIIGQNPRSSEHASAHRALLCITRHKYLAAVAWFHTHGRAKRRFAGCKASTGRRAVIMGTRKTVIKTTLALITETPAGVAKVIAHTSG